MPKRIPYLRTEHLKNPTLSGGTYLYSVYKGVPPRDPNAKIVDIFQELIKQKFETQQQIHSQAQK